MNAVLFIFLTSLLIIGCEMVKRKLTLSHFLSRKITHSGAAILGALAPWYLSKNIIITICLSFLVILLLFRNTSLLSSIQDKKRKSYGELFFPLGEAISAFLFLPYSLKEFQFGMLILGISDGCAGIIGEKYGKHTIRVLGNKKSIEGSVAFFISSFLITCSFAPYMGIHILVLPLLLTLIEICLGHGSDNLILPATGALLLLML